MSQILIVDDSNTMRKMVLFTLKHCSFEIDEASDGKEAFELVKSKQYQGIITDINMPSMDGVSFISEVRLLPNYHLTPILILSTELTEKRKSDIRKAGATGYIMKPFDPEELAEVTKQLFQ